eukprot:Nk52_evm2s2473 gene=Nk52_evmTU2s2473
MEQAVDCRKRSTDKDERKASGPRDILVDDGDGEGEREQQTAMPKISLREEGTKQSITYTVSDLGSGANGDAEESMGSISESVQSGDLFKVPSDLHIGELSPLPNREIKISWLLRFLKSDFFSPWIAVAYLHKYQDQGVQDYLCNELFRLPSDEVEFYLPQLVNLYAQREIDTSSIQHYIVSQASKNMHFALLTIWFLDATMQDPMPENVISRCQSLKNAIVKSKCLFSISPDFFTKASAGDNRGFSEKYKQKKKSVMGKEYSASTAELVDEKRKFDSFSKAQNGIEEGGDLLVRSASQKLLNENLKVGLAFSYYRPFKKSVSVPSFSDVEDVEDRYTRNNLTLGDYMMTQLNFVDALLAIGERLMKIQSPQVRATQLYAELALLNLNFPARVYIPLFDKAQNQHHVVRIPPEEAVTLNSKDKCPFMIQIEVVSCKNTQVCVLPRKIPRVYKRSSGEKQLEMLFDSMKVEEKKRAHSRMSSYDSRDIQAELIDGDNVGGDVNSTKDSEDMLQHAGLINEDDVTFMNASDIRKRLEDAVQKPTNSMQRSKDDPSAAVFKELWSKKVERIRRDSPYGDLPGWKIYSVIVKYGDDLRQELIASQLIGQFKKIWEAEHLKLWLYPYKVLVTSNFSGLIETITDTISVHSLKKATQMTLREYFVSNYGEPTSENFLSAQKNFVESLAAYSLVSYFMQVKDRHNGNLLLCNDGHIVHIDFGFMLSNSPKNLGFETAPFKLTQEFVEVMGGTDSDMYQYFTILVLQGFLTARKHVDEIVLLVEMLHKGSKLPCFVGGDLAVAQLRERFHRNLTDDQVMVQVNQLISLSLDNLSTKLYDNFQYYTNGVL